MAHEETFSRVLQDCLNRPWLCSKDIDESIDPFVNKLSLYARRLYVRLFLRKQGRWIRVDGTTTSYQELPTEECVQQAVRELVECKFAHSLHSRYYKSNTECCDDGVIRELLLIATLPQLNAITKRLCIPSTANTNKQSTIDRLLSYCKRQRTINGQPLINRLMRELVGELGDMIQLEAGKRQTFERLHCGYFCPTELPLDGSQLLQSELMVSVYQMHNYPEYELDPASSVFPNPHHLYQCK